MSNSIQANILSKLRNQLGQKIIGTFGLKIAYVGLTFITSAILARILGANNYGTYVYVITCVSILQIPACLGISSLLVREIAAYQAKSRFGLMTGLLRWANQIVLFVSLSLAILAVFFVKYLDLGWSNQMQNVFYVALISLPLSSLTTVRQGAMEGLNQVLKGQVAETLVQPVLFLILISILYGLFQEAPNVTWIMTTRVLTVAVAFFIGTQLLRKTLVRIKYKPEIIEYDIDNWLSSVLPFLLINAVYVIYNKTDALMLGAMRGTEDVGIYYINDRISDLILFIVTAVNTSVTATIVSLHVKKDRINLQKLVTKASKVNIIIALPITLILIIFGKYILSIFGAEFISGYMALVISCLGKLFIVCLGLTAVLLSMTGYENYIAKIVGFSSIINVILNYILIPLWGIIGAALATVVSIVICNIYLAIMVYKKLKLNPTCIG
ncbi:MAG: flippase [Pleurocapsa sp. SU_5_0]|nr:flippase [Pleurocapsa sp. SU_5_0]NJO97673.1 flippase [Pleurocapsa sp. CRU_1_2]